MPEQILDDPDVHALLQQVRCKAVAKGVDRDRLAETAGISGLTTRSLHGTGGDRVLTILAREEAGNGRSRALVVVTQDAEQLLGQHDVPILAALALADVKHHALAVDIGGREHDVSETRRPAA